MDVTKTRFEDAGEQDENGHYDYYYAGYIYRFVSEKEAFVVRRYDDISNEANFMSCEVKAKRKWKSERFDSIPYESGFFREAIQYLIEVEQAQRITVFLGEYLVLHKIPVPEPNRRFSGNQLLYLLEPSSPVVYWWTSHCSPFL